MQPRAHPTSAASSRWRQFHAVVVAAGELRRCQDAELERVFADLLAPENPLPRRLRALTQKRRRSLRLGEHRMIEVKHPDVHRDSDPPVDEIRICFTVRVPNDPRLEAVPLDGPGIELPVPVVVPMEPHVGGVEWIVIGEPAVLAAQKHAGARGVAIPGDRCRHAERPEQFADGVSRPGVPAGRIAQNGGSYPGIGAESFLHPGMVAVDDTAAQDELIAEDLDRHRRGARERRQNAHDRGRDDT